MPFPLRPFGALGGGGVANIQGRPWHHHITTEALWMGEVALFQDYHGVPYVPAQEMHSESRPPHQPPPTPLNGEVLRSRRAQERHPIRL